MLDAGPCAAPAPIKNNDPTAPDASPVKVSVDADTVLVPVPVELVVEVASFLVDVEVGVATAALVDKVAATSDCCVVAAVDELDPCFR